MYHETYDSCVQFDWIEMQVVGCLLPFSLSLALHSLIDSFIPNVDGLFAAMAALHLPSSEFQHIRFGLNIYEISS